MKRLLFLPLAISLILLVSSCGPDRIEPGFNVTIYGRVIDQSGNPVTNVTAQLWKSDLNLMDNDLVFYSMIDNSNPFKETRTDDNGYFQFSLTATEANNSYNAAAAFFVVSVVDEKVRVSTYSHYFSDDSVEGLTWHLDNPPLTLWNGAEITTSTDSKYIDVSWEDAPDKGTFSFLIYGYWYQQNISSPLSVPTFVLDRNRSINNYTTRVLLRGLTYRYATVKTEVKATNTYESIPIKCDESGTCGGYYTSSGDEMSPISHAITDGNYNYFDGNGKFYFQGSPSEIYIPIDSPYPTGVTINSVVLHGVDINNWEGQELDIYVTTDNVTLQNLKTAQWTKVRSIKLDGNIYIYASDLNSSANAVKLSLTGGATFSAITELSFFK